MNGHDTQLAENLDEAEKFLGDYVVMGEHERVVCVLWAAHTWVFDSWLVTPYLLITSATSQSGKTTLLELLEMIVRDGLMTDNTTAAPLFRLIDQRQSTLLFDEGDNQMNKNTKGDDTKLKDIASIINGGFRHTGKVLRCVGNNNDVKVFKTYSPKAIAGIGSFLNDTTKTRSIPIGLKKKKDSEPTRDYEIYEYGPRGEGLHERLSEWAAAVDRDALSRLRPPGMSELRDRQRDISRPLLVLAEVAGGDWPRRARAALLALLADVESEADDEGVQLLSDIRDVFEEYNDADAITSVDLAEKLSSDPEGHWTWWRDNDGKLKQNAQRQLAKRLKDFDDARGVPIKSKNIRVEGGQKKGYEREQFEDAWERHLPPRRAETPSDPSHPSHPAPGKGFPSIGDPSQEPLGTDTKSSEILCGAWGNTVGTDRTPETGVGGENGAVDSDIETLFSSEAEHPGAHVEEWAERAAQAIREHEQGLL